MIKDKEIAVKAYSMNLFYYLGIEYDWIYPELNEILVREYVNQSARYKARTRQILRRINTQKTKNL